MIGKKLCIRPSVTLFVHETGEKVLEQFRAVLELAPISPSLSHGIGLLTVDVDATTMQVEATPEHLGSAAPRNMPDQPGPLNQRIRDMILYVKGLSTQQYLRDAGYSTPSPVQIYIVGSTHDPWIGHVLTLVRQELQYFHFEAAICYVLDCAAPPLGGASPAAPLPPIDWANRAIADFSFLFDDRIVVPQVIFASEDYLRHYMMAMGLFSLLATSITIDSKFEQLILHPLGATYDKQGTLKSSLVAFPRATVERYCSAIFGAELMEYWLTSLSRAKVSTEETNQERNEARSSVEDIKEWFKDRDLRPNAHPIPDNIHETQLDPTGSHTQMDPDIHLWPTLDLLSKPSKQISDVEFQSQRRAHEQLHEDTSRLFELFLAEEVEQDALHYRKRTLTRSDVAYERAGKAPERFTTWRTRAEAAWTAIKGRLTAQVQAHINQKWPQGDNGVARARIYIDEYYNQLCRLMDLRVALREQHEHRYNAGLEIYREKAAPWMNQPNTASLLGPGAGPSIAPILPGATHPPAGVQPSPVAGVNPGAPPVQQGDARFDPHLTTDEENIAKALRTRANILNQSIVSRNSIITFIATALAGIGTPLLALLPFTLTSNPLSAAIVAGGSALAGGGFHFALQRHQTKQAEEAELDLLKFYCLCYAYRCEVCEDEQRVLTLAPLHRKIFNELRRLEEMEAFIERIRDKLNETARDEQDTLFDGPSALFNLFVVNDSQLQRPIQGAHTQNDKITLDEVVRNIRQQCNENNEPGLEWHNDMSSIKKHFFAGFTRDNSILTMSDDDARDYIINFFLQQLIRTYMVDTTVNAYHALGESTLQNTVINQMQMPLSQLRGVMQPQQLFICGQQPLQENARLDMLRFALTDEREWYLFTSLFHGNVQSDLDINALFPPI